MISNETNTEIFVMKKFLFKSAKYRLWLLYNFSPFYSLNLNEMNRNETKTLFRSWFVFTSHYLFEQILNDDQHKIAWLLKKKSFCISLGYIDITNEQYCWQFLR